MTGRGPEGHVVEVREPGRVALRLVVVDRLPIGRAGDGLLLADQALSRHHCELRVTPEGLVVRDLGSSNGTVCNGSPVDGEHLLSAGDVIRMAKLQNALQRQIGDALSPAETVLPWGRGRVLVLLEGTQAEALNRLQRSCAHLALPADQESYRTRMVIDARDSAGQQGWANAMQRLEQRLFEARLAEPGYQRPAAA